MIVLGLGLHVLNVQDAALVIEECHRKRQKCVAHPHAMTFGLREDEEHPVIGGHAFTHHQATLPVGLIRRDFGFDTMKTCREIDQRHLRADGGSDEGDGDG